MSTRLLSKRYAAIDIGSNAVRCHLVHVRVENKRPIIKKESFVRLPLRLGGDVFKSGRLSKKKSEELIWTLQGFHYLIRAYRPHEYAAVATSALRDAENGKAILKKVKEETGLDIRLLTGKEEALTIAAAHLGQNGGDSNLFIDVGGGSTEIILIENHKVREYRSFNVGTVRTIQGFDDRKERELMKAWLKKEIKIRKKTLAVGTGGNINKTMKILGQKKGDILSYAEILEFYNNLEPMSVDKKMSEYGMKPDRAEVIVPALKIYLSVLKWAGLDMIQVPKIGLTDGMVYNMVTGQEPGSLAKQ